MKIDLQQVEEAAKELYIRALKLLPPDIKQGLNALARSESDAGAKRMLGTMVRNIKVAEDTTNLLCQDTGIPIYNVRIGRGVEIDGASLKEAIRRGCARSTREYSFRSSIVHPVTRVVGCTIEERKEYSRVERAQPRRIASFRPCPSTSTPRPIETL